MRRFYVSANENVRMKMTVDFLMKIFDNQIVENLPSNANEIVRLLRYVQNMIFEKKWGFL